MTSLVIQTSFLGDMILTTPLIERLAARGPVHVVATPANAGLLDNHPAVASVIVFDKRGTDRGLRGMQRVARAARAVGARTAYLAQGSLRTAAIARLAGIPVRVGFATSPGRLLYTRRVSFDASLHHAQRLWQLASPPGVIEPAPRVRPTLHPGARDVGQVEALLSSAGVSTGDQLIAFAPGSVWATKRWPSYAELAAMLVARGDPGASPAHVPVRLVVLGAASDGPLASDIAAAVASQGGAPVIDATGRLSLLASAVLLSRARVLVTNDSAPLHLASAMNTPTLAVFGPTIPAFGFGPLAEVQEVVERRGLACRPCGAHGPQQCPLGHWRCMRDISAQSVADRVTPLRRD
ncbi:MAG: glycosyltransferase family 9 protein [Gemmatimonadaceae bacterium]|nr:glycosyltransferase family 9 protein [Gemmatimonadaceae bacterium]